MSTPHESETRESVAEELAELEHHTMVPYLVVWIVLLVLTLTTFTAARIDMGWFNLPVALAIACTKAGLVVWFFMHLRDHRGMNRIVFITALLFVLLLMGFSVGDVMTRFPLAVPPTHPSEVRGEGWEGGRRQPEGPRNEPAEPAPTR